MRVGAISLAAVLCSCSSATMPASSGPVPAAGVAQTLIRNAAGRVVVEITNHFHDPAYPMSFNDGSSFCVLVDPAQGTIEPGASATIEMRIDAQCQHDRPDKFAFGRVGLESRQDTKLIFGGFISLRQKEGSEAEMSLFGAYAVPIKIEPCTIPWDNQWFVLNQEHLHFTFSQGACT